MTTGEIGWRRERIPWALVFRSPWYPSVVKAGSRHTCAAQCCQSDTWNQPSRHEWVNLCRLRWMTNAVTDP